LNKEDIISSGLLELYALGLTSPEEQMQVEEGLKLYPEVRQELEAIELSLESYAQANAIEPSADVKNKIFERFFMVNANVSTFPGLGLGLYIAAIIIQQHGGRIWLDTAISKGSTFNFVLPNS